MTTPETSLKARDGACLCGAVTYRVTGEPLRMGICHCTDCRQTSGSAFVTFAVWPASSFNSQGTFSTYRGRSFCPDCGSRLFCLRDDEAEIGVGTLLEAPTDLRPTYELWIRRREHWLRPLPDTGQHAEDGEP
jgi:hypothetical protein